MTDDKTLINLPAEDELAAAMTVLHDDQTTDPIRLAASRAELIRAIDAPTVRHRGRRWVYPLAGAAAVAAMVATGFIASPSKPGVSAAAAELTAAASRVAASDPVIPAGKYKYVETHGWAMVQTDLGGRGTLAYLQEDRSEQWLSADPAAECMSRSADGGRQLVVGTAKDLAAEPAADTKPVIRRVPCRDYHREPAEGGWGAPTPEWMAGLPRDPEQLYERLRRDAPVNDRGDTELLVYAADALRTGLLPADLRAALYLALAKIPGLTITDRAANLDGRIGIAYGSSDGETRHDVIIDSGTGQFIGERQVSLTAKPKVGPAGQVLTSSSVRTGVADRIGVTP